MPASVPASLDIASLTAAYAGDVRPIDVIDEIEHRIVAHADPALFIARPSLAELHQRALALGKADKSRLPLYGIPFVVKDNIDVAGMKTTAACPDFAYEPATSASVVARLEAAGAIVIGKANLDQFATGLVGVRSPYGVPRNSFDAHYIPGGSSSGSATSVASGLASFSLGTDTAGSGRVPAGLNNLVGLKPTPGLISTAGVVPACRTLDCVSIFALTVADSWTVAEVAAGFDAADPYAKQIPLGVRGRAPDQVRFGVPGLKDRRFFGDTLGEAAYVEAIERLRRAGHPIVEIDFEPFFAVARLLYEGPWVAERYAAIRPFIEADASRLHPVTRAITLGALSRTAIEAFEAVYALAAGRRATEPVWQTIDALAVPTVTRFWTLEEVEADPIATNSALGTYTNFVNLLGLSALSVPVGFRADALPAGITLVAPGGHDAWLSAVGGAIERQASPPLGATGLPRPVSPEAQPQVPDGMIGIAVVGAHLSGLALNRELVDLGASFVKTAETAPSYKLYALPGGPPQRPGLVRVADGEGAGIEIEIWAMPPDGFGTFVAAIPPPLGIGTLQLADGSAVKGFLAEGIATSGATDVSHHRGWRAYLAGVAV
ncbi:MAG: allophanate hydrolase [Ancalomicrobiaceae bacterium]|nr:allophanate hydrolase [Ancalomicrobiaceae bacterium]